MSRWGAFDNVACFDFGLVGGGFADGGEHPRAGSVRWYGPGDDRERSAPDAAAIKPDVTEVVPEPVREHLDPALAAAADDDLVEAASGHRAPVVDPEPQLRPIGLGVPGADADVPVEAAGGVMADLDDARLAPLPWTVISRCHRSTSPCRGSPGSDWIPASSDSRIPVASSNAMIAASRRSGKPRPTHTRASRESSSPAKIGTGLSVTRGGFSPAIGSGMSSSPASHLKNCCSARYWLLAYAA